MKNTDTSTTFRFDGKIYYKETTGYCYAQPVGGIKKRIAVKAFEEAYNEYINGTITDEEWQKQADLEKEQQEIAKQAKYEADEKAVLGDKPKLPEGYTIKSVWDGDSYSYHLYRGETKIASNWTAEPLFKVAQEDATKATEKAQDDKTGETPKEEKKAPKRAKKAPRKSKDIAHTATIGNKTITLTAKQVDFIHHIPDTCFYENGLESTPWCDVLTDEIGGQFAGKPMTVGAMISTLREKGLIEVGVERVNGKKAKYFAFTEIGKEIAKRLGLN